MGNSELQKTLSEGNYTFYKVILFILPYTILFYSLVQSFTSPEKII